MPLAVGFQTPVHSLIQFLSLQVNFARPPFNQPLSGCLAMVTTKSLCPNCTQVLGCSVCFPEKAQLSKSMTPFPELMPVTFHKQYKTYFPTDENFLEAEPGFEALASGNVAELVKASLGFLGMRVIVAQIKFLMCLKFCLRLSAEVVYPSCKKSGVDICKCLFSCYFSLN